jgi:lipopolysaccharide assembly outer membrane protein LptD (OstA)
MRYFGDSKRTYFYNGVILTQGKAKIFTDIIELDNDKNIAYIDDHFRIQGEDYTVSGNQMVIYIDDEYSELMGNISGFRPAKVIKNTSIDEREKLLKNKNTYLKCDYLKYITKNDTDFIELKGNIVISQDDKSIKGDLGFYDNKNNVFNLEGNIKFVAADLKWMLKKQKRDALKNGDIKKALNLATILTCNKLFFDTKKKIINIIGNIIIIQKDKEIYADQIDYNDEKNIMNLFGNIKVVKDKSDKLICRHIEINLDKEEFFVEQGIESQFKIRKNQKKN